MKKMIFKFRKIESLLEFMACNPKLFLSLEDDILSIIHSQGDYYIEDEVPFIRNGEKLIFSDEPFAVISNSNDKPSVWNKKIIKLMKDHNIE